MYELDHFRESTEEIRYLPYEVEGISLREVEDILEENIITSTSQCRANEMSIYIMKYWSARRFAMLKPRLRNKVLENWDNYALSTESKNS